MKTSAWHGHLSGGGGAGLFLLLQDCLHARTEIVTPVAQLLDDGDEGAAKYSRLFINHPKIRHKVSANRMKYQIYLSISEVQPNFNKKLKLRIYLRYLSGMTNFATTFNHTDR